MPRLPSRVGQTPASEMFEPRETLAPPEEALKKRECSQLIPTAGDPSRCGCGRHVATHLRGGEVRSPVGERWTTLRSTAVLPTDAYGRLSFLGRPWTVRYVRLAFDSEPADVLRLLRRSWRLPPPRLVVSVHGGGPTLLDLDPKLSRAVEKGVVRLGRATRTWLLSSGKPSGVGKVVGRALAEARLSGGLNGIGLSAWGQLRRRDDLMGAGRAAGHHPGLEPNHSAFLLADNGTVGRGGAETALRKRLEEHVTSQALEGAAAGGCRMTPLVCLVLGGGPDTLRRAADFLSRLPPVPVVVCQGSGGAADLLAALARLPDGIAPSSILLRGIFLDQFRPPLSPDAYLNDMRTCHRQTKLLSVFSQTGPTQQREGLDHAILTALFRAHESLSPTSRLNLALAWNRADMAKSEVFDAEAGTREECSRRDLESAMMDALAAERTDFVRLIAEQGVRMESFLTVRRLQELYNTRRGPRHCLRSVAKSLAGAEGELSLGTVGRTVEALMGSAYVSSYSQWAAFLPAIYHQGLEEPLNELLLWAVLTRRAELAAWAWTEGPEPLAKALVAAHLNRRLAQATVDEDLRLSFVASAAAFEERSLRLLRKAADTDRAVAKTLLVRELPNWGRQTCLSLAVMGGHQDFVAHSLAQSLLSELWYGALAPFHYPNLQVLAALLFPPLILRLEFKSAAELARLPQTEDEVMATTPAASTIGLAEDDLSFAGDNEPSETGSMRQRDEDPELGFRSASPSRLFRRSPRRASQKSASTVASRTSAHPNWRESTSPAGRGSMGTPRSATGLGSQHSLTALQVPRSASFRHLPKPRLARDLETSRKVGITPRSNSLPLDSYSINSQESLVAEKSEVSLSRWEKVKEFYWAPISKFWCFCLSYMTFMGAYTVALLVRTPRHISALEIFVTIYVVSLAFHICVNVATMETKSWSELLVKLMGRGYRLLRRVSILTFFIALALRLNPSTLVLGRILLTLNILLWQGAPDAARPEAVVGGGLRYTQVLELLMVSAEVGVYVIMLPRMVVKAGGVLLVLALVVCAFGVSWQAVRFPHQPWQLGLLRNVTYKPYFMMYGEIFAGEVDECGDFGHNCVPGHWLAPLLLCVFMLTANILLINLLIAVFNNVFTAMITRSRVLWRFEHYFQVMEYEKFSALPPPLSVVADGRRLARLLRLRWYKRSGRVLTDHGQRTLLPAPHAPLKLGLSATEARVAEETEREALAELTAEAAAEAASAVPARLADLAARSDDLARRLTALDQRLALLPHQDPNLPGPPSIRLQRPASGSLDFKAPDPH